MRAITTSREFSADKVYLPNMVTVTFIPNDDDICFFICMASSRRFLPFPVPYLYFSKLYLHEYHPNLLHFYRFIRHFVIFLKAIGCGAKGADG